ncbi:protein kinase [Streptomyces monticola]|uniref:non-specific serine/threonine protein kinase n=1 Tax=Streptomyces monticola TaxID=2666263 RepID=A0ABW2JPW3_9ACTN
MDQTEGKAQGSLLAGRYRLGESLGSGGMGKVWRAHDEVLHRTVAVKELTAALYVSEAERAVLLARTQKEARAAARINHSAVVTVHDVFEYDERPWIVMELVDGRSLADAVQQDERIAPAEAARVGAWVVRGLRAAHAAGVLHRDVKPANVLLARDGRVLLTDFGIAAIEGDSTITKTGELVGSIDYLAPERVRGADPGQAADLWALGATLFAAVEGFSPFRRQSPLATMQAVVEDDPGFAEHAGPLASVITALLRKDPAQRPSAEEAERMLAEVAEGRVPQSTHAYVPTRRISGDELTGFRPTAQQQPPQNVQPAQPPHTPQNMQPPHTPQTPQTSHQMPYQAPSQPPPQSRGRKRTWRTAVAVVVAAALVGVGAAVGILKYAQDEGDQGQGRNGGGKEETAGALPKDWKRIRDDVGGFSLLVPPDYERRTFGDQIDYTPDGGRHFIRIGVNKKPEHENSYLHALAMEKQGMGRLPTYDRMQLTANTFRGNRGALWEFTWTETKGANKGERRAIDQLYFAPDGTEYAIYMSGPAADWDKTREQFESVLRGWRP